MEAVVNNVSAEAFGEHLERIVPRLFRYRFDPSAKTRSAMDQLWRSVVGGGIGGGDFSVREKEVLTGRGFAVVVLMYRFLLLSCFMVAEICREHFESEQNNGDAFRAFAPVCVCRLRARYPTRLFVLVCLVDTPGRPLRSSRCFVPPIVHSPIVRKYRNWLDL